MIQTPMLTFNNIDEVKKSNTLIVFKKSLRGKIYYGLNSYIEFEKIIEKREEIYEYLYPQRMSRLYFDVDIYEDYNLYILSLLKIKNKIDTIFSEYYHIKYILYEANGDEKKTKKINSLPM